MVVEAKDDKIMYKLTFDLPDAGLVVQLVKMEQGVLENDSNGNVAAVIRVKNPDEDDWGKLKRVIKHLNGTKYLKLRLTVEDLGMLKWYIDGSHNVHWDNKGHGGAVFMMGKGAVLSYSSKLKLNTRNSTETELVTADMFMQEMLWSLYFIQAQGYEME